MIADSRITDYILSLETGQGQLCDRIEQEALAARVPIIRRETAALLKTLVAAKAPRAILDRHGGGVLCPADGPGDAGGLPDYDHRKI